MVYKCWNGKADLTARILPTLDGENEELNWRRWYKRAVQKSAEQIWALNAGLNPIHSDFLLTRVARNVFRIRFQTLQQPSSIV